MDKFIKVISENNLYKYELNLENNDTKLLINEFKRKKCTNNTSKGRSKEQCIYLSMYIRWIYSLLVASDYYATSEFMNDMDFSKVSDLDNIGYWNKFYEDTSLLKNIRKYQKTKYPLSDEKLNTVKDINILRSEIFL